MALLVAAVVAVAGFFGGVYKYLQSKGIDAGMMKLAAVGLAGVLVLGGSGYGIYRALTNKNGLSVSINDAPIGIIKIVKDKEITGAYLQDLAVKKLEQSVGMRVQVNETVSVEAVHASNKEFVTENYVVNEILNRFTYLVEAAAITVNGQEMALVRTVQEANDILDGIKDAYLQDGMEFISSNFVEDVQVTLMFREEEEIITKDRADEILTANVAEQEIYTIRQGDSLDAIAAGVGMTRDEIIRLNPGYSAASILRIGATLTLTVPKPILSVETREQVTQPGVIEKPVQIQYNENEHRSYTKILRQGREGQETLTVNIVRINGFEDRREIVDRVTIVEPEVEIKEVGTNDAAPQRALGSFIMPAQGRITDSFRTRGGTHMGIDVANAYGTGVYASDGGVVTKARDDGDGYGQQVIIDHGNGFVTSYAHNSRVLVTVGQRVAQGEHIANMGSSGDSTGNHCHFEMLLHGAHVDPFEYIH